MSTKTEPKPMTPERLAELRHLNHVGAGCCFAVKQELMDEIKRARGENEQMQQAFQGLLAAAKEVNDNWKDTYGRGLMRLPFAIAEAEKLR